MLELVPAWLGHAMRPLRAGADRLCVARLGGDGDIAMIDLSSPAFPDGGNIPARFTADGEGLFPPLLWDAGASETAEYALIVEDPDAPSPRPLVHAALWGIAGSERALAEGSAASGQAILGRNSFRRNAWLPPDPPPGHGRHHYVFQLFALSGPLLLGRRAGRSALVKAMRGRILAVGVLTGIYSRGEPAAAKGGTRFMVSR